MTHPSLQRPRMLSALMRESFNILAVQQRAAFVRFGSSALWLVLPLLPSFLSTKKA